MQQREKSDSKHDEQLVGLLAQRRSGMCRAWKRAAELGVPPVTASKAVGTSVLQSLGNDCHNI